MPPEKVFARASRLLDHLGIVLEYQSDRFNADSIEEFSDNRQEKFAQISAMLADASSACGRAFDQIERVRGLLK